MWALPTGYFIKIVHIIAIKAIDPIAVVRINVVACAIIFHLDGSVSIFITAMLVAMQMIVARMNINIDEQFPFWFKIDKLDK